MEEKRTIGYICPACGAAAVGERTVFALSAGPAAVVCDCGKSEWISETDGAGHFRLTVPCGICGGEHLAQVDAAAMLAGKGIALSCPETSQLCCFIGEDGRVSAAMRELEITAEKMRAQRENPETFADSTVMYEILSELRDMARRDGISCACGSRRYGMDVRAGAVDLVCRDCGAKLRLPAVTDEDLDQLCCRYTLTIPGTPRVKDGKDDAR